MTSAATDISPEQWAADRIAAADIAANHPPVNYKLYHVNMAASYKVLLGKRVLVLGCNRGEDCKIFIDLGAGFVCGLDVMDEIGQDFTHPRVEYIKASAEDIPRRDKSFDCVFAYATLEHVPDIFAAFKEMARVCDSGGIIYSAASPLWNSRQGPHWGNWFDEMPWLHLRKSLAEIQAYNRLRDPSPFNVHEIAYFLDDRPFNKRWAREYLAAGWSVPAVEVLRNELQSEPESVLTPEVFSELSALGYSKRELLALTHIFVAKRL